MDNLYDVCHGAGGMTLHTWEIDPKRLVFQLARYKWVAKMLQGKASVLEVGCADGFGSRIVRQHVGRLTAIDIDPDSIAEAKARMSPSWPIGFEFGDIMSERDRYQQFDGVYCLDLFEHIVKWDTLLGRLVRAAPVCIIGTPSLESQQYASDLSRQGHCNCMTGEDLRKACLRYWDHVFMFSMNDEVVGTGFLPMAHYLLALCVRGH